MVGLTLILIRRLTLMIRNLFTLMCIWMRARPYLLERPDLTAARVWNFPSSLFMDGTVLM